MTKYIITYVICNDVIAAETREPFLTAVVFLLNDKLTEFVTDTGKCYVLSTMHSMLRIWIFLKYRIKMVKKIYSFDTPADMLLYKTCLVKNNQPKKIFLSIMFYFFLSFFVKLLALDFQRVMWWACLNEVCIQWRTTASRGTVLSPLYIRSGSSFSL